MPLDDSEAEGLVTSLWPEWRDSREKSEEWQSWALGRQELPVVPDTANNEYRELQEKAITPWLGLVVQALSQALIVEGYRRSGADEDSLLWGVWQANNMDAKQIGVHEAAFTTGISYVAVLPTESPAARSAPRFKGRSVPEWRPYSSSVMTGFFESAYDDWPVYAIAAEPEPRWRQEVRAGSSSPEFRPPRWRISLFDDAAVYLLRLEEGGSAVHLETRPHTVGVCPVVAFVNRQTIGGRALGEVEPYTALASRIDQDVFDRLVVQRFLAWVVRTATGLVEPDTEEGQKQQDMMLRLGDVLVSDSPDTKFGSIPGSPLDGHLRAPIEDAQALAAVAQIPPTHLTSELSNISADALAAITAGFNRKIGQRKRVFGEAHERCFALTSRLLGVDEDPEAEVRWADLESRSLAQLADAFGKLAQMLDIPVEVLWPKLGFLTDQELARAKELRAQGDGVGDIIRELRNGQAPAEPAQAAPAPAVPVA